MSEIILTQAKYDELKERLHYLETEGRAQIAQDMKTAREYGDLSENAEWAAAKEAQSRLESEVLELKESLLHATIIDESSLKTNKVSLGNTVTLLHVASGKEIEYKIVSSAEASSLENKISDQSPVGKAIIGRKKGETVEAVTPRGAIAYTIIKISK